ncbi:arrestin domain-containing protein 3-like isoform X2 [Brachionichthys hirsutus]|uniref:arrestin domain-containing protein 3-like isoform X2 n=1 Tax=Brachionichthys hirsutus TaxID=412623 RepID=UPI003604C093
MSPIQDLKLTYTIPNNRKTLSEGDTIRGSVTFSLTKRVKVKRIVVKVKGDARVEWTEGGGDEETSYSGHRRYFKLKENLVPEGAELHKGSHHFKFKLKIPEEDMPPSFKGPHGKIVYMLEAKISRSWWLPSLMQEELNFTPKSSLLHNQVMCPHTGSVRKEFGVFSKGQIRLTATVDKKVCSQGDTLSIVVKISNFYSQKIRPKFSLLQKTVFRARTSTKTHEQSLCTMVGDTIKGNTEDTVSCRMRIPIDAVLTVHNCDIISVDHYLKVCYS